MTVVGFDLDMTLVDARPAIGATLQAVADRLGVHIDVTDALGRVGIPLADEFARWVPLERVAEAVTTYRKLYREHANRCRAMPGAAEAVAAVWDSGGYVVVITSKLTGYASAHLDHVGLRAGAVLGDRYGGGKTEAMQAANVTVYVGDHVADVDAARRAGATAVGVATGNHDIPALTAAGANPALLDLTAFPSWWAGR